MADTVMVRRLNGELKRMMKVDYDIEGIWARPAASLSEWKGKIKGPPGTPYEEGEFHLTIKFGSRYPFEPPQVIFNTKIYHANFSSSGAVCINILKDGWVSGMTVDKLLVSIRSLMADANPNDPLVPSIAAQFTQDRMKHDTIARKWVEAYAKKKD